MDHHCNNHHYPSTECSNHHLSIKSTNSHYEPQPFAEQTMIYPHANAIKNHRIESTTICVQYHPPKHDLKNNNSPPFFNKIIHYDFTTIFLQKTQTTQAPLGPTTLAATMALATRWCCPCATALQVLVEALRLHPTSPAVLSAGLSALLSLVQGDGDAEPWRFVQLPPRTPSTCALEGWVEWCSGGAVVGSGLG